MAKNLWTPDSQICVFHSKTFATELYTQLYTITFYAVALQFSVTGTMRPKLVPAWPCQGGTERTCGLLYELACTEP